MSPIVETGTKQAKKNSLNLMRYTYWIERLDEAEELDDLFALIGAVEKEIVSLPAKFLNKLYFKL